MLLNMGKILDKLVEGWFERGEFLFVFYPYRWEEIREHHSNVQIHSRVFFYHPIIYLYHVKINQIESCIIFWSCECL